MANRSVRDFGEDAFALFGELAARCRAGEELLAWFERETSDFVRFHASRVRSAGAMDERTVELVLARGRRHARVTLPLTGARDPDHAAAREALNRLRERIEVVPEDPFFTYATEPTTYSARTCAGGPAVVESIEEVATAAEGLDLAGIYMASAIAYAFASTIGHRHVFATTRYQLDASVHAGARAAVKLNVGGTAWDAEAARRAIRAAAADLRRLDAPAHDPRPGEYRAYLAPPAVAELLHVLAWGGFGLDAHRSKESPLLLLGDGRRSLSAAVTLRERRRRLATLPFTGQGFLLPDEVLLIERGRMRSLLVDARSAARYGAEVNAASESPSALVLDTGEIDPSEVPRLLGRGLFLSNLWYANYSDRAACRITAMSRYASFWVDDGELVAPLAPVRIDDTVYRMLGDALIGLTRTRQRLLDSGTYGRRSLGGAELPGVLVEGLRVAL